MSETTYCKSCKATITWVVTANGKRMPIDAEPSFKGNIRLDDRNVAHFGKAAAEMEGPRYISHFATCPQGPQHRRK